MTKKRIYKIADIWNRLETWQKAAITILISVTVVYLSTTRAYSGTNFLSKLTKDLTDNITDEIFDSLNQSVAGGISSCLDWVQNILLDDFAPSFDKMKEYTKLGAGNKTAIDYVNRFAIICGMFISTILYGFSMLGYMFNKKITDVKDTPISLTFKYFVAVAICYKHQVIIETFIKLMNDIYKAYTMKALKGSIAKVGFAGLIAGDFTSGKSASFSLLGTTMSFAYFPGVSFFILIIQIVLLWKLMKALLRMYLEMVSRYIVSIVLLSSFSLFGGTMVSNSTGNIFKSYLRTLFSSFLVLIFNVLWFKLCLMIIIARKPGVMNLMEYIFILEMLHFGVKIDSMLRSMGLGVATGMSSVTAAMKGSGRELSNTIRNIDRIRRSGGDLIKAAGINSGNGGNRELYRAGAVVGAKSSDLAKGNVPGSAEDFARSMASAGRSADFSSINASESADIIRNNVGRRDASAISGLSSESAIAGMNSILADRGISVNEANLSNYKSADGRTAKNCMEFTGEDKDGNTVHGFVGMKEGFSSSESLGNGMSVHYPNRLKNGETCSLDEASHFAGSDANKAISDAKSKGVVFPEGSYIEKDGMDSNKMDNFNVVTADNKNFGTISGNKFTRSAESMNDAAGNNPTRDKMFADIQDKLIDTGNYANVSAFEQVKDSEGTYRATAQTINDNEAPVFATDKGIHGTSKLNSNPMSFMERMEAPDGSMLAYDVNVKEAQKPSVRGNTASGFSDGGSSGRNIGKDRNRQPAGGKNDGQPAGMNMDVSRSSVGEPGQGQDWGSKRRDNQQQAEKRTFGQKRNS